MYGIFGVEWVHWEARIIDRGRQPLQNFELLMSWRSLYLWLSNQRTVDSFGEKLLFLVHWIVDAETELHEGSFPSLTMLDAETEL
jgi:hypothetical protein